MGGRQAKPPVEAGSTLKKPLLAVILVLASALAALVHWHLGGVHTQPEDFDSAVSKQRREAAVMNDPGCVRGGMAMRLQDTAALAGLSREQLVSILGQPDRSEPHLLTFALGQCHWDWRHSELAIWLDSSGLAENVAVRSAK